MGQPKKSLADLVNMASYGSSLSPSIEDINLKTVKKSKEKGEDDKIIPPIDYLGDKDGSV